MCIRQASMFNDLRSRLIAHGFTDIEYNIINMAKAVHDVKKLEEASPNIPVHQETEEDNAVTTLGAGKDHFLILDSCNRLVYQVIMPWSFLFYPYVKAAILSAYNDKPCGDCNGQSQNTEHVTLIIRHVHLPDIFKATFDENRYEKHSHRHKHHHHHHHHPHHHHHHHHHHRRPEYHNFGFGSSHQMSVNEQYDALKLFLAKHLLLLDVNNDTFQVHSHGEDTKFVNVAGVHSATATSENDAQSDIFENSFVHTDELTKVPEGTNAIWVEKMEGNAEDEQKTISKDEILSENSPPLKIFLWYPHYHIYNGQRLKDHYYVVLNSKDPNYHGHVTEEEVTGDAFGGEKEHGHHITTGQGGSHTYSEQTEHKHVAVQTDNSGDSHVTGTTIVHGTESDVTSTGGSHHQVTGSETSFEHSFNHTQTGYTVTGGNSITGTDKTTDFHDKEHKTTVVTTADEHNSAHETVHTTADHHGSDKTGHGLVTETTDVHHGTAEIGKHSESTGHTATGGHHITHGGHHGSQSNSQSSSHSSSHSSGDHTQSTSHSSSHQIGGGTYSTSFSSSSSSSTTFGHEQGHGTTGSADHTGGSGTTTVNVHETSGTGHHITQGGQSSHGQTDTSASHTISDGYATNEMTTTVVHGGQTTGGQSGYSGSAHQTDSAISSADSHGQGLETHGTQTGHKQTVSGYGHTTTTHGSQSSFGKDVHTSGSHNTGHFTHTSYNETTHSHVSGGSSGHSTDSATTGSHVQSAHESSQQTGDYKGHAAYGQTTGSHSSGSYGEKTHSSHGGHSSASQSSHGQTTSSGGYGQQTVTQGSHDERKDAHSSNSQNSYGQTSVTHTSTQGSHTTDSHSTGSQSAFEQSGSSTVYGQTSQTSGSHTSFGHAEGSHSTGSQTSFGQASGSSGYGQHTVTHGSTNTHSTSSQSVGSESSSSHYGKGTHTETSGAHHEKTGSQTTHGSSSAHGKGKSEYDDKIIFRDSEEDTRGTHPATGTKSGGTHFRSLDEDEATPEQTKEGQELINHYSKILPWIKYPVD